MPHTTHKAGIVLIALFSLLTSPTLAQPDREKEDTLRGPSIPIETRNILGTTDMNGRFTPVEGRPELAAFALVADDPDLLASARDLDNKRVFDLTIYLVDEIDTVREITDAITSGNGPHAQLLLAGLRQRYEPDLPRDPLADALSNMLTPDQQAEFTRIIEDYWSRWVLAQLEEANTQPTPDARARTENLLNHQLFQQDIRLAYDSSLKRYRDSMDAIYSAIEPTIEQRAMIRDLIIDHIKATRLKATIEQRQAVMLEIYNRLDEQRKERLFLLMTRAAIARAG